MDKSDRMQRRMGNIIEIGDETKTREKQRQLKLVHPFVTFIT